MKKQIVIGCLLSIFVLLLVPSIPALQYSMVKEANIESIRNEIITDTKLSSRFSQQKIDEIISTFLTNENSISKETITKLLNEDHSNDIPDEEPLFFPFLGIFIYLLIFYIIYIIIASIVREVFDFVGHIVDNIKSKIQNFIDSIINIILTIISLVFTVVKTIIQILGTIGQGIINGVSTLLQAFASLIIFLFQGILTLVVLTVQGIVLLLKGIWKGLGEFFRLLIEIVSLIIDEVFPNTTA